MRINFSNKFAYTIIVLVLLILVAIGINAYGGNTPSVMGHSANELAPPTGCNANQFLRFTGTTWDCAAGSGGITGVTAGTGLTGGGTSGTVTVSADTTYLQRRVIDCPLGQAMQSITVTGNPTCLTVGGGVSGWTDDGSSVRLTTSTDNVGIGTTTPGAKLDVSGTSNIELQVSSSPRISTDYSAGAYIELYNGGTGDMTLDTLFSAGDIILQADGVGNVGVGTTTAGSKLTVAGDIGLSGAIKSSTSSDVIIQLGP